MIKHCVKNWGAEKSLHRIKSYLQLIIPDYLLLEDQRLGESCLPCKELVFSTMGELLISRENDSEESFSLLSYIGVMDIREQDYKCLTNKA